MLPDNAPQRDRCQCINQPIICIKEDLKKLLDQVECAVTFLTLQVNSAYNVNMFVQTLKKLSHRLCFTQAWAFVLIGRTPSNSSWLTTGSDHSFNLLFIMLLIALYCIFQGLFCSYWCPEICNLMKKDVLPPMRFLHSTDGSIWLLYLCCLDINTTKYQKWLESQIYSISFSRLCIKLVDKLTVIF